MSGSKVLGALLGAVIGVCTFIGAGHSQAASDDFWSGFYVGAHAGFGGGSEKVEGELAWSVILLGSGSVSRSDEFGVSGFLGGGQIGFNHRIEKIVLGLEADISASDMKSKKNDALIQFSLGRRRPTSFAIGAFESELLWFGTGRGKVGYLLDENLLVYATGGIAFGEVKRSFGSIISGPLVNINNTISNTTTEVGFAVGLGVEAKLNDSFSIKGEIMHVDLGGRKFFERSIVNLPPLITASSSARSDLSFDLVRIGINWHFNMPLP